MVRKKKKSIDRQTKKILESLKGKKVGVFVGYKNNMAWEIRQLRHIYLNRIKSFIA